MVAGVSASARLNRRTELARTLQKTVTFAALAFLDLPFSFSSFLLTSCPSTRTWSYAPFLTVVATRSAKSGQNTTTRCHSVFELHSSSAFFHERCVAIDSTVNFEPLPFA